MSPVLSDDDDDDDDDDNGDDKMVACQEENNDMRVLCLLQPKANYHTDFEFSMVKDKREIIINTNVSGMMPDPTFRHNSYVEELKPYGFRLTIMRFTITENTTFFCKVSREQKTLFVESGKQLLDIVVTCECLCVLHI